METLKYLQLWNQTIKLPPWPASSDFTAFAVKKKRSAYNEAVIPKDNPLTVAQEPWRYLLLFYKYTYKTKQNKQQACLIKWYDKKNPISTSRRNLIILWFKKLQPCLMNENSLKMTLWKYINNWIKSIAIIRWNSVMVH